MRQFINEEFLKKKIVNLWLDYPCLYDTRSQDFKNHHKREKAMSEMAEKLEQNSKFSTKFINFLQTVSYM